MTSNSEQWPPCIITAFDLVGTKSAAATGRGSSAMIQMHRCAVGKIIHGLPRHSHGYVWNDSVMLLSYEAKPAQKRAKVLQELDEFKQWLQGQCGVPIYAIAVMGLAFPQGELASAVSDGQIAHQPRAVVLKTSSWAMANCFLIEKDLGKHRADWYIDSRIVKDVSLAEPMGSEEILLLPSKEPRRVFMYRGGLHVEG